MSYLQFEKSGNLVNYVWCTDTRTYVRTTIQPDHIFKYLRDACRVEDGVTLLDIFTAVQKFPMLEAFIGMYSWCNAKLYHAEAGTTCKPCGLDRLEIEVWFRDNYFDISLHGYEGAEAYAIDFTPLNSIAHLPLTLSNKLSVHVNNARIDSEEQYTFSLLDVLDAIYYEISFHGSPIEREAASNELHAIAKSISDGSLDTVPFDFDALDKA